MNNVHEGADSNLYADPYNPNCFLLNDSGNCMKYFDIRTKKEVKTFPKLDGRIW